MFVRPCIQCGKALPLRQEFCDNCQSPQVRPVPARHNGQDSIDADRQSEGTSTAAIIDLGLRTMIGAVPISAVAALLAFLFLRDQSAIYAGMICGIPLALGYSLLEMYAQRQALRGPLNR